MNETYFYPQNLYLLKGASLPFIVCVGKTKLYSIYQMIEICEQSCGGCC